jgi:cytochrome c
MFPSASLRSLAAVGLGGAVVIVFAGLAAVAAPDVGGDVASGRDLFATRCVACHGLNPARKPGPPLAGVYGREAGTVATYPYSPALKGASIVWNGETLDRWLRGPPAFIPGVNMQAQVDGAQDRRNIIAYLKSLNASAMGPAPRSPPR